MPAALYTHRSQLSQCSAQARHPSAPCVASSMVDPPLSSVLSDTAYNPYVPPSTTRPRRCAPSGTVPDIRSHKLPGAEPKPCVQTNCIRAVDRRAHRFGLRMRCRSCENAAGIAQTFCGRRDRLGNRQGSGATRLTILVPNGRCHENCSAAHAFARAEQLDASTFQRDASRS